MRTSLATTLASLSGVNGPRTAGIGAVGTR